MSPNMKLSSLYGFICVLSFGLMFIAFSDAHSYFSSISIDGVARQEDDCMRPHPSSQYDYPISQLGRTNGLTSNDMTCGWLPAASRPANRKCPVNPGSRVTLQWHYERGLGASDNFIIDPSHKGPCIVYMAKSETGAGAVWFKIFEDGYDTTTRKWCVDKLRANGGKFDVTIPTDITPGNYLLRGELIALHEGDQLYGAQPYVGCAELTVGGSGTRNPGNLVSIPGVYTPNDAGIRFNIYSGRITSYPVPGPPVYVSGSSPAPTPSTPVTTAKPPVTTGVRAATTGAAARAATTGSARSASTTTTTGNQPATSTTGDSKPSAMCYLPGTPNLNGRINRSPPTCGKKSPRARCAQGQCCSQYGYCGPFKEKDGNYYEYIDNRYTRITEDHAMYLYCNASSADYRKVPCNSIKGGIEQNAEVEYAEIEEETTSSSTRLLVLVYFAFFLTTFVFLF